MPATDQSRTKSAYGLQWNRFRIIRAEEDRATFFNRTGLTPAILDGKLVLDAGCGMGRYLRIAAAGPVRHVIGMDLSRAVVAARELTAHLPGVSLVRGDLLRLPFPEQSFDIIYSLGVLDHTPDPRAAFLGLARLLKPGGRIVVWVYEKERPARGMDDERAAGDLDAPAAAAARASLPHDGSDRRAQAPAIRQPAPARAATGGGPSPPDHRRLDASRSRGAGLRHARLVRTAVPFAAYVRRSCRLVPRGRAYGPWSI